MADRGKLTEAMVAALQRMERAYGTENVKFQTGEALRKRGLAERYTQLISKAVYVSQDSETVQSWPPAERHEWYITPAGRALLSSDTGKRE